MAAKASAMAAAASAAADAGDSQPLPPPIEVEDATEADQAAAEAAARAVEDAVRVAAQEAARDEAARDEAARQEAREAAIRKAEAQRRKDQAAAILRGKPRRKKSPKDSKRSPTPKGSAKRKKGSSTPPRPAADVEEEDWDALLSSRAREALTLGSAAIATVGGALSKVLAEARYTDEQKEAAVLLQHHQRRRAARIRYERFADFYWTFVYDLQRERAATALQRWIRARWARDKARADLDDLRGWDALLAMLSEARVRRTAAVEVLQRQRRLQKRVRRAREWRKRELRKRSSAIWAKTQNFTQRIEDEKDKEKRNPFSKQYVGQIEHRRLAEADSGAPLGKFGKPSQTSKDAALPAQVATLLNVLRFVDAVNEILRRSLVVAVPCGGAGGSGGVDGGGDGGGGGDGDDGGGDGGVDGQGSASGPGCDSDSTACRFEELMSWNGQALQGRFSGAVQYLRSGKRYGLLDFDGELPQGQLIRSLSFSCGRDILLRRALEKPHLVVPTLPPPPSLAEGGGTANQDPTGEGAQMRKQILKSFAKLIDDFLEGTFETDVLDHAHSA